MKKALTMMAFVLCVFVFSACSDFLANSTLNQTAEFKELKTLAYAYNGEYVIEPKLYDEMNAVAKKRAQARDVPNVEQRREDKLKAHFGDEYESLQTQYDKLFEKGYDSICGGFHFVPFTSKCPGDPRGYVEMAQRYAIDYGAPKMGEFVEKYNEFTAQSEKEKDDEIVANLAKAPQILSNGKAYKCEGYIEDYGYIDGFLEDYVKWKYINKKKFGGTLYTIKEDIYTDIAQTSGKGNNGKFKDFLKASRVCYTSGESFTFRDEILDLPDKILSITVSFEISINEANLKRFWRIKPYYKKKNGMYNDGSSYFFGDMYFEKIKVFIKGKNGHFERLQELQWRNLLSDLRGF
ncbi:hypothetical protein [Helicobacter sp. T3_23-1056]